MIEEDIDILQHNLQVSEETIFELLHCLLHNLGQRSTQIPDNLFNTDDSRTAWEGTLCLFLKGMISFWRLHIYNQFYFADQFAHRLQPFRATVLRSLDEDKGAISRVIEEIRGEDVGYTLEEKAENLPMLLSTNSIRDSFISFRQLLDTSPDIAFDFPVLPMLIELMPNIRILRL